MYFTVYPYGTKTNILHVVKRELAYLITVDKKIKPDKEHLAHIQKNPTLKIITNNYNAATEAKDNLEQ